jgi:hypothetical protein
MLEMKLRESDLPVGTLEEAVTFLRGLHWHPGVKEVEGFLYLRMGHTVVLKTDSKDVVNASLYGAATAYRSLPESILAAHRDYLLRHFGGAKDIPELDSGL